MRHTARMGVRYGVMGDTAEEVAAGLALLQLLEEHGVQVTVTQRPAQIASDRWLARATPELGGPAPAGG